MYLAAKVYGGVFAFLAPFLGPAAAGPASASSASVLAAAVPAADVGGYVLSSGLANIHAGETILPAQMNQPYQGGAGGTSGPTINLNGVYGTQAWVNSVIPQIARALQSYSNLNPSVA